MSVIGLLALALAAGAAPTSKPEVVCAGPRSAFPYPIVLKSLIAPRHRRVDSFSAWTYRSSHFTSVPIQVEEINSDGDYVLDGGLPYTKNTADGWFNARDELVLAGEDAGDDFPPGSVDQAILATLNGAWKVGFCVGGRRIGWLLIGSRRGGIKAATWAGAPVVRFDKARGEVETPLYSYKFDGKNPVLLGEVMLRNGPKATPVIRDTKFLMPLRTPFWMPDMTFADEDFTSTIESWQTGPLRTIVAVGVRYTSFLSMFKLHLFSELVFYRNRFVIPTVIQFVFDPAKYLSAGSGIAYALRFPPGKGWEVTSNLAPLPAKEPEEAFAGAPKASDTQVFYAKGRRPEGAFQVQVRVDAKARADVPSPFLLRSADFTAKEAASHWPWLADMAGSDLGVFLDFSRIHQGTYDFGLDLLLSAKASETFTDYGSVDSEWQPLPQQHK